MLTVRHISTKIIMAVSYCRHQLALRLGWTSLAYHMKEGAMLHPRVCKHSLQYDWRPDGCFWVQVGTWNFLVEREVKFLRN